jgi:hypothetical protein
MRNVGVTNSSSYLSRNQARFSALGQRLKDHHE